MIGSSQDKRFRQTTYKYLKWLGVSFTLLVFLVWITSGNWYCGHAGRVRRVEIIEGRLQVWQGYPDLTTPNWYFGTSSAYRLKNRFEFQGPKLTPWKANAILIPLWYFGIALGVPTVVIWIRDQSNLRRARNGNCVNCGFDLAGLSSGAVYPECGKSTCLLTRPPMR